MLLCDVAGGPPARVPALSEPAPPDAGATARDDLKAYLRIAVDDDDAVIDRLVATAIGHGELFTGRLFLIRAVIETIVADTADWRRLRWAPVRAIDAVAAIGADGSATPLPAGAYALEIDGGGEGWCRILDAGGAGRARVGYQAGVAAGWAALPDPLRQGAIRLAAHLYSHRDAADEGAPPAAVAALWRPWRRMRLA